jgi:hypothetical protein
MKKRLGEKNSGKGSTYQHENGGMGGITNVRRSVTQNIAKNAGMAKGHSRQARQYHQRQAKMLSWDGVALAKVADILAALWRVGAIIKWQLGLSSAEEGSMELKAVSLALCLHAVDT